MQTDDDSITEFLFPFLPYYFYTMEEISRTKKLFEDLYDGDNWIGITLWGVLSDITSEQAAQRINSTGNTIWEITNHLIQWRENVMQRVQGKTLTTPEHNYFEPVTDTSKKAWQQTLKQLKRSQDQWLELLRHFKPENLEKVYAPNQLTYFEHIQGILQHDAYHLGQIVLLTKQIQSA